MRYKAARPSDTIEPGKCRSWVRITNPRGKSMLITCDEEHDDHTGNHEHKDKYGGTVKWPQH